MSGGEPTNTNGGGIRKAIENLELDKTEQWKQINKQRDQIAECITRSDCRHHNDQVEKKIEDLRQHVDTVENAMDDKHLAMVWTVGKLMGAQGLVVTLVVIAVGAWIRSAITG